MEMTATALVTGGVVALTGKIVFDWFKQMQKLPSSGEGPKGPNCSQVQAVCREERDRDRRELNEFKICMNNAVTRISTQVEGVRSEIERSHTAFKEFRDEIRDELRR